MGYEAGTAPTYCAPGQAQYTQPAYNMDQQAGQGLELQQEMVTTEMERETAYQQVGATQELQVDGAEGQNAGEPVVKGQVGDWLICEDQMGEFYSHVQTGQSVDQPPEELL